MIEFTYYYFNILITIIILIIVAFSIYSSLTKKDGFYDRLSHKLSLFIGFFLLIGVFLTYSIFKVNYDNIKREATLNSTEKWIKVLDDISENHKKCPHFINSLYFDWQKNIFINNKANRQYENEQSDDWAVVNWLSIKIFQVIEDFLVSASLDVTTNETWISNFLHWTNSKILYSIWKVQYSNFDESTNNLIELLFYYSFNNKINNEKDVRSLAHKICQDKRFLNIFENKKKEKTNKFNNIFG